MPGSKAKRKGLRSPVAKTSRQAFFEVCPVEAQSAVFLPVHGLPGAGSPSRVTRRILPTGLAGSWAS